MRTVTKTRKIRRYQNPRRTGRRIKSTLDGIYSMSIGWRKWQRDYETGMWKMRGSRTGV